MYNTCSTYDILFLSSVGGLFIDYPYLRTSAVRVRDGCWFGLWGAVVLPATHTCNVVRRRVLRQWERGAEFPVTKHQICLGVKIRRANAGQDSRNLLTRSKLLGENGNREFKTCFLIQLSMRRIGNHTQLVMPCLLRVMATHTQFSRIKPLNTWSKL